MDVTAQNVRVRRGTFALDVPAFHADCTGTALLGPNGAGKTTLLLALHGLIPAAGRVERPSRTASVFARPAVLRGSVLWNVASVCETALGTTAQRALSSAREALHDVGLQGAIDADARTLSTGQRQRLAIARALVIEPEAILLDEPFANLDADARPALRALVGSYVRRTACALVLATSSLADTVALCRDVVVLRGGTVRHTGTASTLETAGDPYVGALLAETAAIPS